MAAGPYLSIVVPLYKERDNIRPLHAAVSAVAARHGYDAEMIYVDDGSPDDGYALLRELAAGDRRVRALRFARNAGQTAALEAGITAAVGEIVVTMDGDLQNDPEDIPLLLAALKDHDCACGDRTASRAGGDSGWKIGTSRIANAFRNWITRENIRDAACCFRAFRRTCFPRVKMFRGMHRFLPTLFRLEGFSVVEVPVRHHPRRAGASKYGTLDRLFTGLADCLAVAWMRRRVLRYEIAERIPGPTGD
jgi:glycosyltransferase involved in cell wall biosynthesis